MYNLFNMVSYTIVLILGLAVVIYFLYREMKKIKTYVNEFQEKIINTIETLLEKCFSASLQEEKQFHIANYCSFKKGLIDDLNSIGDSDIEKIFDIIENKYCGIVSENADSS